MQHRLLIASLLVSAFSVPMTTHAEIPAKQSADDLPQAREACVVGKLDDKPLVQFDERSDYKNVIERQLLITTSGAWRATIMRNGKQLDEKTGCLDAAELTKVEDQLAGATWSFKLAEVRCRAKATTYLQYRYEGLLMATTQICDGKRFDVPTQRALDHVTALALALIPSSPKS